MVEVKLYQQGRDLTSLKKYGMFLQGTLIINEKKKVTKLSSDNIRKEIQEAISNAQKKNE